VRCGEAKAGKTVLAFALPSILGEWGAELLNDIASREETAGRKKPYLGETAEEAK